MERNTKRKVVAGAIAAALLAGAGGAIAATKLTSPGDSQAILNDAAKRLNVEPSALSDALKQAMVDQLDAAVKAGTLTQAQADAMKARIQSSDFPLFGGRGFHGGGFGAFGGKMDVLAAAADYLKLTQAQLMTQLRSGKSLADIAKAQGKTADGLVQAITDQVTKDLDAAVAAGKLTKDQEQTILANVKQSVTAVVNGTGGKLAPGFGFGFGGRAFGGFGGAFGAMTNVFSAAADYLKLTQAQLMTQLASGKSLADVAKAQGKTADGLVQAMTDQVTKDLNAAVAAGKLTKDQEQQILTTTKQWITAFVNGTGNGKFGFGFGPGFGFGHGGGRMMPMPAPRQASDLWGHGSRSI